jgi:hypothetical protein
LDPRPADPLGLSWDEYQYLPVLDGYQQSLADEGLLAFLTRTERFGYGSAFWQLYALFALPFRGFGAQDGSAVLLWLRLLTLALQLGCLALVLRSLELLHPTRALRAGAAAAAFLAPMCGLQLLYKPFSPDYLIVFSTLTCAWLLAGQATRGYDRRRWTAAAVCLGFALGGKFYAIFALPMAAVALARFPPPALRVGATLRALLGGAGGFLLANLYLFRVGFHEGYLAKLISLGALVHRPNNPYAVPPGLFARVSTWVDNGDQLFGVSTAGLAAEFAHPSILLGLTVALAALLFRNRGRASFATVVGATGVFALLGTVLLTNRVWTWYAIGPIYLCAVGVGSAAAQARPSGEARRWLPLGAAFLLALHASTQAPGLWRKSRQFWAQRQGAPAQAQLTFYAEWVAPRRTLFAALEREGYLLVKGGQTPLSPLHHERVVWGHDGLAQVDEAVGAVVDVRRWPEAQRAALRAAGFASVCPAEAGTLFVRAELLERLDRPR